MKKALIVLYGTAFRSYLNGDNIPESEEYTKAWQSMASDSHVDFFNFLKKQYNIEVDITYALNNKNSEEIYNELNKKYYKKKFIIKEKSECFAPKYHTQTINTKSFRGSLQHIHNAHNLFQNVQKYLGDKIFKDKKWLAKYEFVFILRIDIFLKEYFWINCFNPESKAISYPYRANGDYICDVFFFIPKYFFNSIGSLYLWHDCFQCLVKGGTESRHFDDNIFYNLNEYQRADIIFNPNYISPYIDSWHQCRTYTFEDEYSLPYMWNPLYLNSRKHSFIYDKIQKKFIIDEFCKINYLNYSKSFQKFSRTHYINPNFVVENFSYNLLRRAAACGRAHVLMFCKLRKDSIHAKNFLLYEKKTTDFYTTKKLIKNCLIYKIKFQENSINLCNFSSKSFFKSLKKINNL